MTASLVLITVDCLRADHVGFLGYLRPTTPFLDSLSAESYVFENALVGGAPTYYSMPAILASRHPLALGRDLLGLVPGETTIASALREAGFRAAAFLAANPYLSARFGYEQGFDVFLDFLGDKTGDASPESGSPLTARSRVNQAIARACHAVPLLGSAYDELYFRYCHSISNKRGDLLDPLRRFPSADVIVDHAISWLRENAGGPFFLWLHLMDPHAPYFPKEQALRDIGASEVTVADARYLSSFWAREGLQPERLEKKRDEVVTLYDAGIRWADTQIRRLSEALVELNVWGKCALAVTADHGEEFLEHGGRFHAPFKLHEVVLRVPLLLRVPEESGGRCDPPTGLIDLAPTMLDILNVPAQASFRGHSLWSHLQKCETWNRTVITECVSGCTNPFYPENRMGQRILAVRKGSFKLIVDFASGTDRLFDLQCDPDERNPLPLDAERPTRRALLERARKHVAESYKSRGFESRFEGQMRDLRLEWAHPSANAPN